MVSGYIAAIAAFLALQRGAELMVAAKNRRWSLAQGAVEYGERHYPLFFLLHGAWFAGWMTEGMLVNTISIYWQYWLFLFIAAQCLRYWCIVSLGKQWNTRIIIIPGAQAVRQGPYRLLPHPNYLAVAIELICIPMLFGAPHTAVVSTIANACLLLFIRIPAEEKALRQLAGIRTSPAKRY